MRWKRAAVSGVEPRAGEATLAPRRPQRNVGRPLAASVEATTAGVALAGTLGVAAGLAS